MRSISTSATWFLSIERFLILVIHGKSNTSSHLEYVFSYIPQTSQTPSENGGHNYARSYIRYSRTNKYKNKLIVCSPLQSIPKARTSYNNVTSSANTLRKRIQLGKLFVRVIILSFLRAWVRVSISLITINLQINADPEGSRVQKLRIPIKREIILSEGESERSSHHLPRNWTCSFVII